MAAQGSIMDSDSEDEMPAGWEERVTLEGKVYYANHNTQGTQWTHPVSGKKKKVAGELPYGWERKVDSSGVVFYVDHINEKTTFTDPRLAFAQEDKPYNGEIIQKYDASTKAIAVLQGRDLSGKYILVTGANSGIGFETVKALAFHGAHVVMACRNFKSANECIEKINRERPQAKVQYINLDLTSLRSVQQCAKTYIERGWPLHVLILNAGVFGVAHSLTEDGYETTFQVNHLGHFYLTQLFTQLLIKSNPARVVVLSSESHRFSTIDDVLSEAVLSPDISRYSSMRAYNDSKLCNVLFSNELQRRLCSSNVTSNVVHPGNCINTRISRQWWMWRLLFTILRPFTKSTEQGASTTVFCAVSKDLEGVGGMYWNNCCQCISSEQSRNEKLAKKLWDISATMIDKAERTFPVESS
ncbi:unnamed protein product [Owenia fusiformis]|uniref:WW domain-containing oxidoreductase n=1 Tax=Owenia fusiformis TaxID=6347 RepID=A0A8J1XS24_OWEFU|nr:unnamed protein product [Owenia fusiformis]